MMRALLTSFVLLVVFACNRKESVPANVLPKDKMEAILWDLIRADQFMSDYVFSRDTTLDKKKESTIMYQRIFAMHKVSKDEFKESFTYYRSHPVLFKEVMDSIGRRSYSTPAIPIDTTRNRTLPSLKAD